jgi:hypothetical protein
MMTKTTAPQTNPALAPTSPSTSASGVGVGVPAILLVVVDWEAAFWFACSATVTVLGYTIIKEKTKENPP